MPSRYPSALRCTSCCAIGLDRRTNPRASGVIDVPCRGPGFDVAEQSRRQLEPMRRFGNLDRTAANQHQDVVELLLTQHRQIKQLLDCVKGAVGSAKREPFEDLSACSTPSFRAFADSVVEHAESEQASTMSQVTQPTPVPAAQLACLVELTWPAGRWPWWRATHTGTANQIAAALDELALRIDIDHWTRMMSLLDRPFVGVELTVCGQDTAIVDHATTVVLIAALPAWLHTHAATIRAQALISYPPLLP